MPVAVKNAYSLNIYLIQEAVGQFVAATKI